MTEEKRKRGRPKGKIPPLSSTERTRMSIQKLKAEGGMMIALRVDGDVAKRVDQECQRLNLSRTGFMRKLLRDYFAEKDHHTL